MEYIIAHTKSGKPIFGVQHLIYHEKERRRGWNIAMGPLHPGHTDGAKLLKKRFDHLHWTKSDHANAALAHKAEADKLWVEWTDRRNQAHLDTFGKLPETLDYKVSGVGSDEYNDFDKSNLRRCAQLAGDYAVSASLHNQIAFPRSK